MEKAEAFSTAKNVELLGLNPIRRSTYNSYVLHQVNVTRIEVEIASECERKLTEMFVC